MGMSAAQHQHYLPQSYQLGWADASGRPHVYEWRHHKLVCTPKATKSTGGRTGLYFTPMAPPEHQNFMEDVFWRRIDQWGADGLGLLRADDPSAGSKINKERLATFVMSFLFRNPRKIAQIEAEARKHLTEGCLKDDYTGHRRAHEPDTFAEFVENLNQPGMTEYGARLLRSYVLNNAIRDQILTMVWQVVTVTNSEPILTSDVPLITYKGLKDDDGLLILPLSRNEFFVAFNRGKIDMLKSIDANIQSGVFVAAMNQYVVQHKIEFVYGIDDSQMEFVARHWAVSEAPVAG
jgi:hypothetical protein